MTDTLAHELVDRVFQSHDIILEGKQHETDRGKGKQAGNSKDQVWPERFIQTGSVFSLSSIAGKISFFPIPTSIGPVIYG